MTTCMSTVSSSKPSMDTQPTMKPRQLKGWRHNLGVIVPIFGVIGTIVIGTSTITMMAFTHIDDKINSQGTELRKDIKDQGTELRKIIREQRSKTSSSIEKLYTVLLTDTRQMRDS